MRFALSLLALSLPAVASADTPEEVFATRIVPIFKSPNPSSCTQCHLSGVDLKDYIRSTHRETFLSLRDQGLVDLDHPEKSKILHLIDMGKAEKAASENQQKIRRAESEAFAAWVKASCADAELRAAPKLKAAELAKPAKPNAVIRHARKDRLLESFENTVWALRFRCAGCHSQEGHANKKHVEEYGERMTWLAGDAAATLAGLMSTNLMNVREPEKSPLLLKALGAVKHGGGVKFTKGDEGYKVYRRFLDDYAKVVTDKYAKADELPTAEKHARFGTEAYLKITNTPPAWADKFAAVKLFAWDAAADRWRTTPTAVAERVVSGERKVWSQNLTLIAPAGSDAAKGWKTTPPRLPAGKYLVKIYLDTAGKIANDWRSALGDDDSVGQAVIESTWPTGHGKPTVLDAAAVQK